MCSECGWDSEFYPEEHKQAAREWLAEQGVHVNAQEDDGMRTVTSWEHRNNNSGEYITAHLECGHERTFNGNRPIGKGQVRCWECGKGGAR